MFSLEIPEGRQNSLNVWRVAAEERREIFLLGWGGRTSNLKFLDFRGSNCCGRDVNQAQKSDFLPFHVVE